MPHSSSDRWIAWAIHPTGTGMARTQSLIAFKDSKGSVIVKTYNIISYSFVVESKLFLDVWETKVEFSDGVMRIFVKVKVLKKAKLVNHIWQVGASITDGHPDKHEFKVAKGGY
ncbi:hypothetical protein UlMin_004138 [Ulmus minor]